MKILGSSEPGTKSCIRPWYREFSKKDWYFEEILGLSFGFTEEYTNGIDLKVDKDEGKGWTEKVEREGDVGKRERLAGCESNN